MEDTDAGHFKLELTFRLRLIFILELILLAIDKNRVVACICVLHLLILH